MPHIIFKENNTMKRTLVLLLLLCLLLCLFTACTKTEPAPAQAPAGENVELIVFAAASMTETLNKIAELYKKAAPNVTLVFNFDSSGTLKTQIQEGADCDLFISAAPKQMNALDKSKDAERRSSSGGWT